MNPFKHALLALALCLALPAAGQEAPPPSPVNVEAASSEQIAPLLWVPGSVLSRTDARVASEQDGRVIAVAELGTVLRRGEVLARLDTRLLELSLARARAERERIRAQLAYAQKQAARLTQLASGHTIAGAQADEAAAQRDMLTQDLQRAEVGLRQAEHHLSSAAIRAPFDGVVAERLVAVGEYLGVGAAVVRLVETARLDVQARAPVSLAAGVALGSALAVRIGEAVYTAQVRAVVPVADANSRQFELRLTLEPSRAPIGAAVEVGVPSAAPRAAVVVPRDAVLLRPGETVVMRIKADLTAERVVVLTGVTQGERIEVSGAIQAGDRVVVRGAERLAPGQKVLIAGGAEASADAKIGAAGVNSSP